MGMGAAAQGWNGGTDAETQQGGYSALEGLNLPDGIKSVEHVGRLEEHDRLAHAIFCHVEGQLHHE